MLPARFDYHRPDTVEEAVALLEQYGEDGKVLSGGMSLIPLMKLRFAAPAHLIDINRIAELGGIAESGGWLHVKAATRHNQLGASETVMTRYPAMAAAAPQIADPIVRNLGTIGGSLAHADPAGDWGSVMLGGRVLVRSVAGERTIPVDELLESTFTTTLQPNELITEVQVPAPGPRSGGTYLKLERKVGDFATVGVAVQLALDDGRIASAGIGLTAVGQRNVKATDAEASLQGAEPNEVAFAEAGRLAARVADPTSDLRGSADYKRHVVQVFVQRGLSRALELAQAR